MYFFFFFIKFGCSICIFLNSADLIYQSSDILKCFRESFDFEITRVDCIYILCVFTENPT